MADMRSGGELHCDPRSRGLDRAIVIAQLGAGAILLVAGAVALAWAVLPGPRLLPGAHLELSSAEIDLGTVRVAEVASGTVAMRNIGDRAILIERVEAA